MSWAVASGFWNWMGHDAKTAYDVVQKQRDKADDLAARYRRQMRGGTVNTPVSEATKLVM